MPGWKRLIRYVVPTTILTDHEQSTKAKFLVALLLLNVLFGSLFCGLFCVIGVFENTNYKYANALILSGIAGNLLLLPVFKKTGSFLLVAHLLAVYLFITFVMATFLTGGYSYSPLSQFLLLIPVYVFMLAGRRSGMLWAVIVMITYIGTYVAEKLGIQSVNIIHADQAKTIEFMLWIAVCCLLTTCLFVYEFVTESLRNTLSYERNQYAHKANHDALTQLPNRALFEQRLYQAAKTSHQRGLKSALLLIDLDGFKPINDRYGHHTGDLFLQTLAKRLKQEIRQTDTVARLGGDEFAVILEDVADRQVVERVSTKILNSLSQTVTIEGQLCDVTASIGAVMMPEYGKEPDLLTRRADLALYRAKAQRNTYWFFDEAVVCESAGQILPA